MAIGRRGNGLNLPSRPANYPLTPARDLHVPGPTQPPVVIDWGYWQKRRTLMAQVNTEFPQYLVLPEIHRVLEKALNPQLHFLLNLMWHTGARITEALSVTREDLILETVRDSLVILANSKRRAGRPRKRTAAHSPKRMVPIADPALIDEAKRYLAGSNPKKGEPIFSWNRHQVRYQLNKLEREHFWNEEEDRSILPVESLSPHTFRHSFAVNCLLQGRDIRTIQDWMGHAELASTEVYLKVLSGETHHLMYGVQF